MAAVLEKTRPAPIRRPALMTGAAIPPARPVRTVCANGCNCPACNLMASALAGKINVA